MTYWIFAFVAALAVVIGVAGGLAGAVIAALAFGITLFLLWAHKLGFDSAWRTFGLDRYVAPILERGNRDRFIRIFDDNEKLGKACTVALALVALWLILPKYQVAIAAVVALGWYGYDIYRAHAAAGKPSAGATLELPPAKDDGRFPPADSIKAAGAGGQIDQKTAA